MYKPSQKNKNPKAFLYFTCPNHVESSEFHNALTHLST